MNESKLKWGPYGRGSTLKAEQKTNYHKSEYWVLDCVNKYKLDIEIRQVRYFDDIESAKAFAEKLEGLTDDNAND